MTLVQLCLYALAAAVLIVMTTRKRGYIEENIWDGWLVSDTKRSLLGLLRHQGP